MSRPYRELLAYKHSTDHGTTWRTKVLCSVCKDSVEPPERLKCIGETGARACEWCGCGSIAEQPANVVDREHDDFVTGFMDAISRDATERGEQDPFAPEDLPPNDVCDLSVAYSPVIPIAHGDLLDAVEVIKINEYRYSFEFRGEKRTVSDEELKTMRIRYIVTANVAESQYMVAHNPEGSIWHDLGKRVVEDYPIQAAKNQWIEVELASKR